MLDMSNAAGLRLALALRIGEAALASTGWQGVAGALQAELGPDFALHLRSDGADPSPATASGGPSLSLPAPGLGTWILDLPEGWSAAEIRALPLAETLALASRLADGLPLRTAEMEAVLDPMPYATMLLDGEARLLFANAAGEDLLRSRRLFRPARPGARLRAAEARVDEALDEAVARLLGGPETDADWTLRGSERGTHLAIRLRAVGPAEAHPGAARLLLTLRAIGAAHPEPPSAERQEDGTEPA